MKDVAHEWLSLAILIIILGIAVILIGSLTVETNRPIVSDYEDKTALPASGSIIMSQLDGQTGADILLSLANVDINVPYPRAIRINGGRVIKLDNTFQSDLVRELSYIYNHDGLKDMLDWKVVDVIYVYTTRNNSGQFDILVDSGGDMYGYGVDDSVGGYWQYILEAP